MERLTNEDELIAQFKNEYGRSISSAESRWEVRLAAGNALERDMTVQILSRATEILDLLVAEAKQPTEPLRPGTLDYASRWEGKVTRFIDDLVKLGDPIIPIVRQTATAADGKLKALTEMLLARLGDPDSFERVTQLMTDDDDPSIRFCAAHTLRRIKNPSARPALWKALKDPFHRPMGGDMAHRGDIYPIQLIASDALVELGEDFDKVKAERSSP